MLQDTCLYFLELEKNNGSGELGLCAGGWVICFEFVGSKYFRSNILL